MSTGHLAESVRVENAYDLFLEYVKQGETKISHFEDKSEQQLEWWYSCCAEYLKKYDRNAGLLLCPLYKRKVTASMGRIYITNVKLLLG